MCLSGADTELSPLLLLSLFWGEGGGGGEGRPLKLLNFHGHTLYIITESVCLQLHVHMYVRIYSGTYIVTAAIHTATLDYAIPYHSFR